MRDMIPPGDRSIRNIPVHHTARRDEAHAAHPPVPPAPRRPRKRRRTSPLLWIIALILVAASAAIVAMGFFDGATITLYPKELAAALPASLDADLNPAAEGLRYQRVSVVQYATTTVPASGTKKVSRQATGVVTITSTYSSDQRLISNTRFEATDGKIYRLQSTVTVPANGTAIATLAADSPGPDYNKSGTVTFTLPAFKGDPRYTKFSAKAQEGFAGGFVGNEPAVAQADLDAGLQTLKDTLSRSASDALQGQVQDGFVAVPGSVSLQFGDLMQVQNGTKADLSRSITATGAVLRLNDLASALARVTAKGDYKGEPVMFKDLSNLKMMMATSSGNTITLAIEGAAPLQWVVDPTMIKEQLVGKDVGVFQQTVASFAPAIKKADANIRPFWSKTFPTDPAKLQVILKSE